MKLFLLILLFTATVFAQQTINDLTVKDFKVVSTTKGAKPCPLMTSAQISAIVNPLNGQCAYNTTSNNLNIYNGSVWKAAGGGIDNWVTATVYSVGDLIIQSNKIYQCLIAHTSGTFATDLAALKWQLISASVTDHTLLTNIGTNTHAQIDTALSASASHIANTSNPHSVTKAQVGLSAVPNLDTSTTANITSSTDKRFVTDANLVVIGNTSGTNTGDQTNITGNAATVTTNANLTGDVTSSGNATTYNNIVSVAKGGTGLGTLTSNNVILGNGASSPTFVAPGASGNVLTSNGTTWTSVASSGGSVAWTSYTPTFQGLGTTSSVDFYYQVTNNTLCVNGKLQSGTPTAAEVRIGLPSTFTIGAAGGTNKANGYMVRTLQNSLDYNILMTATNAYVGLGLSTAPFIRQLGTGIWNPNEVGSVNFCVPL